MSFSKIALFGLLVILPVWFSLDSKASSASIACKLTIEADKTDFNEKSLFYYASGNAIAKVEGQDAKIEADVIRYSDLDKILDARGNVRITRNNVITKGGAFRFKVSSNEYLITKPDCAVDQIILSTRSLTQKPFEPNEDVQSFLSGKSDNLVGIDNRR